ncbi:hypothetical protein HY798_05215 [Candidatus Falkowbacteria bacterium]|nr:hypothetical protein [Candidatus Falkowbacteria bacterium]
MILNYYLKITKLKIKKLLKFLFLFLFLFQLLCLALLLALPQPSNAADSIQFDPQVDIPGSKEFGEGVTYTFEKDGSTKPIAQYIIAIYKYAIGIVGILATVVMMVGGVIWLTAGGNSERISKAKEYIGASLTGLVIALASFLILSTINPALTNFKITNVTSVTKVGCCTYKDSDGNSKFENLNETDCGTKKGTFSKDPCSEKDKICEEATIKDDCTAMSSKCFWYDSTCRDNGSLTLGKEDCNADTEGQKCLDGIVSGVCKDNTCFLCESKIGGYCSFTSCCPGLTCNTEGINECE